MKTDETSEMYQRATGIPLARALNTTLFLLFSAIQIALFADDTTAIPSSKISELGMERISQDIIDQISFFTNCNLKINSQITQLINFSKKLEMKFMT